MFFERYANGFNTISMRQDVEEQIRRQAEHDSEIESKIARKRRRRRGFFATTICLTVVVVSLVVWAAIKRVSVPELGPADFFQEAVRLQAEGEIQQTINLLKRVLSAQPEHEEARWLLGQTYLSIGDGRAAEKEIRHVRLLGGKGLEVQFTILESMLFERRYMALLIETAGLSTTPDSDYRSQRFRAEAQFGLRRYAKAAETVADVLRENDSEASALSVLTRLHLAEQNIEMARDAVDRLERVAASSTETVLLRARVALLEGDYQASRELFESAMSKQVHPEGRLGLAQTYLAEGRPDEALAELSRIKRDPSGITKYLAAVAHFQKGDVQTMRGGLRKFLSRFPDHLDGLMLMARVNHLHQELRQAETGLSRLLSIAPDDLEALKLLATVHLDIGQIDEAQAVLDRALGVWSNDSALLGLKARAFLAAGDAQAAQELLTQATELAAAATGRDEDVSEKQWQLLRCGLLVHFCERCLFVRECL